MKTPRVARPQAVIAEPRIRVFHEMPDREWLVWGRLNGPQQVVSPAADVDQAALIHDRVPHTTPVPVAGDRGPVPTAGRVVRSIYSRRGDSNAGVSPLDRTLLTGTGSGRRRWIESQRQLAPRLELLSPPGASFRTRIRCLLTPRALSCPALSHSRAECSSLRTSFEPRSRDRSCPG